MRQLRKAAYMAACAALTAAAINFVVKPLVEVALESRERERYRR